MKKEYRTIGILVLIIIILLIIIVAIGFLGYKYLFGMDTVDATYNTLINVSTLGIDPHTRTNGEKLFTGFYSLLAGVFFIATVGVLISLIVSGIYEAKFVDKCGNCQGLLNV